MCVQCVIVVCTVQLVSDAFKTTVTERHRDLSSVGVCVGVYGRFCFEVPVHLQLATSIWLLVGPLVA